MERAPGSRIRDMIEAAAAKRRAAIHGEEAARSDPGNKPADAYGLVEASLAIDEEDEDAVMEEITSEFESEDESVKYHFVPAGGIFHNNRSCVALELSPTIHSAENPPEDRRLCRYCAGNSRDARHSSQQRQLRRQ